MESRRSAWLALVLVMAGGAAVADEPLATANKELASGDYAAALRTLDALPRAEARAVEARFLRGIALMGSERLDEAAAQFEAIIADQPRLPEVYNNLAAIYVRQGRLDEAKQMLERALATDPRYATVYENLSTIYVEQARSSYAKALRLDAAAQMPHLSVLNTVQTQPVKAAAPLVVAAAESLALPPPAPVAAPVVPAPEVAPHKAVAPAPAPKPAEPVHIVQVVAAEPVPNKASASESVPAPLAAKPVVESEHGATPAASTVAAAKPAEAVTVAAAPVSAPVQAPPVVAAAPAPVVVAVVTPEPEPVAEAVPERLRLAVLNALDGWARAWSEQNPDKYLAYYAADYVPEDMARSAWEDERRTRLSRPAWIKVMLEEQEVSASGADEAVVTLKQRYASPNYKDITFKRLTLALRDGNWVITSETNLRVRR